MSDEFKEELDVTQKKDWHGIHSNDTSNVVSRAIEHAKEKLAQNPPL